MIAAILMLAAAPGPGYHKAAKVTGPTRLDWTFAVATRSLVTPPKEWLGDYDSTATTFELYVPPKGKKPPPVLLFVSPSREPSGWKAFARLCKARGILFAGPRGAGNDCPPKRRVRMALDVLDQLRRDYKIDPARTYVTGFSGGGRIAAILAFALPELFGGVMPICASGTLREEPWLRQRSLTRLRIAMLTGEKDFNRGEVERLAGTYFRVLGAKAKVWTQPGMGHAVPGDKILGEAFAFLETGAKERGSPVLPDDREKAAQAFFDQGDKLARQPKTEYRALMVMVGVLNRWPDTKAGAKAKAFLSGKEGGAWEKEDVAKTRLHLVAQARALDAYAMGPMARQYEKQRAGMLKRAVEIYELLIKDSPGSVSARDWKKRVEAINAQLKSGASGT